jgi:hypothetical protein
MARVYQRNAESSEKKAVAEDARAAAISTKLGRLAGELATAEANLDREIKSAGRRDEAKRKADERAAERAAARRRAAEKTHARQVARMASPTVTHVHEVRMVAPPKPEPLRVLYLTSNPEQNLRTEAEVRGVQEQVTRALHRDQVQVLYRPAATQTNRSMA